MSNQDTIKKLGAVVNENLPHILTGVAAVGVVTTAIESARAALKIKDMDTNEEDDRKASEKAKSVFFALLPPVVSGALTLGCLISSDVVHTKRYTSLLGAFVLAKGELPKYKEELAKIVSPEKKKEIERQMAENRVKENDTVETRVSRYLDESKYVKHRVVDQVTGATLKHPMQHCLEVRQRLQRRSREQDIVRLKRSTRLLRMKRTILRLLPESTGIRKNAEIRWTCTSVLRSNPKPERCSIPLTMSMRPDNE